MVVNWWVMTPYSVGHHVSSTALGDRILSQASIHNALPSNECKFEVVWAGEMAFKV